MLQTNTVEGWSGVITDLSTKQQAAKDHLNQLRKQKEELSLEAALGSANAKKKLDKINSALAKAGLEGDDFQSALTQAQSHLDAARKAEAADADLARHAHVGAALADYLKHVHEIDKTLAQLAAHFQAAKKALDDAEPLMTNTEAAPMKQLRSAFGPTLAASYHGLGGFIELGSASSNIPHRAPLEQFAAHFCDRWLKPNQEEVASGK